MQNTKEKIYFNFSYFALKLLGKGLYNNAWSAISELVANSLDAQSTSVKLYINMTDKEHSTIEILDNGTGMNYKDLAEKYVFMGLNKREDNHITDDIKNSYMGRKGIGKLAALYLSKKYYLITKTGSETENAWCLDSQKENESDIPVLEKCDLLNLDIETREEWNNFHTGTMIKLTNVDLTGIGVQTIEGLKARLADFFLIDSLKGKIEICVITNDELKKEFYPIQKSIAYKNMYAFCNNTEKDFSDELSDSVVVANSNFPEIQKKKRYVQIIDLKEFSNIKGKKKFILKNGELSKEEIPYELKGWIGIHTSIDIEGARLNDSIYLKNKAYKPTQLRLYVRKKLAVENFLDILKNTQALSNYIEGEISFDILDDDRFEDITTTNRQSLIEDNERVQLLIDILRPVIGKLIRTRAQLGEEVRTEIETIKEEKKRAEEEAQRRAEEEAEKAFAAEKIAKEAEEARKIAEKHARNANKRADIQTKRGNFLEKLANPQKTLDALVTHIIKQISLSIETDVLSTLSKYYRKRDSVLREDVIALIERIAFNISLIRESSLMATKADFDLKQSWTKGDIYAFIQDYQKAFLSEHSLLEVSFQNKNNIKKEILFKPAQVCVFIANIIDNAYKADSHRMVIICETNRIIFKNNGEPLDINLSGNDFFQKGISTTSSGSGLGLYHCKLIAEKMNASLHIANNINEKGVSLIMEFSNEN